MESDLENLKINTDEGKLIDKLFDSSKQIFQEFLKPDNNPSELITYDELVKYVNKHDSNCEFINYNHALMFINDMLVSMLEDCLKNEDTYIKKQEKEVESVYLKATNDSKSLENELKNQKHSSVGVTGLRTPKKNKNASDIIEDLETMTLDYSTFYSKYKNVPNDSNYKAKWLNSNRSKNETLEYSIARGDLSFSKDQLKYDEIKINSNKNKLKVIDKRLVEFENQVENLIHEYNPNNNANNYASNKDFQLNILKIFKKSVIDSLMKPNKDAVTLSYAESKQVNEKNKLNEEIKELDKKEKELDKEINDLKMKSQNKNNAISLFEFKSSATLFNLALVLCIFIIIIFYN